MHKQTVVYQCKSMHIYLTHIITVVKKKSKPHIFLKKTHQASTSPSSVPSPAPSVWPVPWVPAAVPAAVPPWVWPPPSPRPRPSAMPWPSSPRLWVSELP